MMDHFRLWGDRLVMVTFFDLVMKYGQLTTEIEARVLYDRSKEHRDEGVDLQRPCTPPPPPTVFGLPLFKLSALESRFVAKAGMSVRAYLSDKYRCNARTHSNHIIFEKKKHQHQSSTSTPADVLSTFTKAGIQQWQHEMEATFDGPQEFHYEDVVKALVKANACAVHHLVPDLFPRGVPQVNILPNVPIGGCMIPYDFCFETAPSQQRVSFPNYNILTDAHRDHFFALPELAPYAHRRHFHYLLKCIIVPSHEIIHVYQGVAKQRDTSPGGWSAEHDASVPAMSLLFHVAQCAAAAAAAAGGAAQFEGNAVDATTSTRTIPAHVLDNPKAYANLVREFEHSLTADCTNSSEGESIVNTDALWKEVATIYGNGVLEAALLDLVRELKDIHALLSLDEIREYERLKAAFGTKAPPSEKNTTKDAPKDDKPLVAMAFKSLLPYEYFAPTIHGVTTLLRAVFEDRFDMDTSDPESKPKVPVEAKRHPGGWFFQRPAPVHLLLEASAPFTS